MKLTHLILIAIISLLAGCDRMDYASLVSHKFQDSEVVSSLDNRQDTFLVRRPDGSIWYVRANGKTEADIQEALVFPALRK